MKFFVIWLRYIGAKVHIIFNMAKKIQLFLLSGLDYSLIEKCRFSHREVPFLPSRSAVSLKLRFSLVVMR
jgi:hypothetical protein